MGIIEYEELRKQALFFRPAMILCGASAYPCTVDFARFRAIACHPHGGHRSHLGPRCHEATGTTPGPSTFLLADVPGSLFGALALASMGKIADGKTALNTILFVMTLSMALAGLMTHAYSNSMMDGISWQVFVGAGIGLLLSDTAVSQRNALKELLQLVKLGPLHDAVVSRRKASMDQSWFGQEWSLAA